MQSEWLANEPSEDVAVYVVWSPQLGAEEGHVRDATRLIPDGRVRHFWDPDMLLGRAYQAQLGTAEPAWDVWMLFPHDATWGDEAPAPAWWEHQLGGLPDSLRLDPARFADHAGRLVGQAR